MGTYRNRMVERNLLKFLSTLPCSMLTFPFDPAAVALHLKNCKVYSYQSYSESRNVCLEDIISYCQSETGCTHNNGNNYIIMYNDSQEISNERKVFTIAHELGHIVLGHFKNNNYNMMAQNGLTNKVHEREANHFAAYTLCPLPVIHKLKPTSICEIQKTFGLSYEAAEISWRDYINYDRNFNIAWHNDILYLYRHLLPSRI